MLNQYQDILTAEDVSEILMIGMNRTYSLLNSGMIKGFRIRKKWRIARAGSRHIHNLPKKKAGISARFLYQLVLKFPSSSFMIVHFKINSVYSCLFFLNLLIQIICCHTGTAHN